MLEWLSKHERIPNLAAIKRTSLTKTLLSKLKPPPSHILSVNTSFIKRENGSTSVKMNLRPGIGVHYIKYKDAWIEVNRSRDTKMIDLKSGAPWETIQLRTLSMDKHLFLEMLQEGEFRFKRFIENSAKNDALAKEVGKTVIYTSYGHEWRPFGQPRRKRVLSSVILDDGISDRIHRDLTDFLRNGAWVIF